ncbi:putative wall-associated receptor kinase [Helianthus anomalus]
MRFWALILGCGPAALIDNERVLTACSTICSGVTLRDRNSCFGIGCCQSPIPQCLKLYNINITRLEEEDGGCGSALMVDETSYNQARSSDLFIVKNTSFIPISLLWTLTDTDQVICCDGITPITLSFDMVNDTTLDTWKCYNTYSEGSANPYLLDGCKHESGM